MNKPKHDWNFEIEIEQKTTSTVTGLGKAKASKMRKNGGQHPPNKKKLVVWHAKWVRTLLISNDHFYLLIGTVQFLFVCSATNYNLLAVCHVDSICASF
jgi:hypothetical protein